MVAIITLAIATRVPSESSSSTSSGSSSSLSSMSQTLSSNTTTSAGSSETESSADVVSSSSEIPSSSMILFTVTFNAMEGSPVNAVVIYDGGLIPSSPLTERTGYTFDGWYRSEDNGVTLGDSWNFALNSVTSDITLYAKWTINTYYIFFVNYVGGLNIPSRYVYQAIPTPTLDAGETIVNIISSPGPVTYFITSTNRTLALGRGMDGQIGDGDTNMFTATAFKNTPIFISFK